MEQWPTHRPEARRDETPEVASFSSSSEDHNASAGETGEENLMPATLDTAAENRLHDNPRIAGLMQGVMDAERRLKDALVELEQREESPAFQKASELYQLGYSVDIDENHSDGGSLMVRYSTPGTQHAKICRIGRLTTNPVTGELNATHAYIVERDIAMDLYEASDTTPTEYGNLLADTGIDEREDRWDIVKHLILLSQENNR